MSWKLDGIRARIIKGRAISRSGKLIPNRFVQDWVAEWSEYLEHMDGELIVGEPHGEGVFSRTSSGIMSQGGQPRFNYWVFDYTEHPNKPFAQRYDQLLEMVDKTNGATIGGENVVRCLTQTIVNDIENLNRLEDTAITRGYEGIILRDPYAPYKNGRSTLKQFGMVKLKRFMDAEARVVALEERMHNANPAEQDALGYTKHSSHKEGKVGTDTMGALVCRLINDVSILPEGKIPQGTEFNIGTGFDDLQRHTIWVNPDDYIGRLVKFKYLPVGSIDKPRHPVFLGWRHTEDL